MEQSLEEFEWNSKAMGTEYSIAIVCSSYELALEMYLKAKNKIESYESRFSRFIPTSELSLLNEQKSMIVSPEFLDVTQKSYALFKKTKGIFNPLVQISRLGYNKNFADMDKASLNDDDDKYNIDFELVVIDSTNSRIILSIGQKLDFGGMLKGYLAEIMAKEIIASNQSIHGVIVNLGGDIHSQGLDKDGKKFEFHIYNPILDNEEIAITLYNQSLATSGTYKRSWKINHKEIHHILNASGNENPASSIISASIVHDDGATAEAYAKVFLSMDPTEALNYLHEKSITYVVIKNNGQILRNET